MARKRKKGLPPGRSESALRLVRRNGAGAGVHQDQGRAYGKRARHGKHKGRLPEE